MKTVIAGAALLLAMAGGANAQERDGEPPMMHAGAAQRGEPRAAPPAQPQAQSQPRPQSQPGGGFQGRGGGEGRGGGSFQRPQGTPTQAAPVQTAPAQQSQPTGDRAFRPGFQGGTGGGFNRGGDGQGRRFGQPGGQAAPVQSAPTGPQGDRVQGRRFDDRQGQQRFDGQRFGGQDQGAPNRGFDGGRRFDGDRGGPGGRSFGGRGFEYRGNSHQRFRAAPFRFPRGYSYRPYRLHERLPYFFLAPSYFLNDWSSFYLAPPPSEHFRWVRYGPDALLVDTYTGEVVDAAYGVFDDGQAYGEDGYGAPGMYSRPYGEPGPY